MELQPSLSQPSNQSPKKSHLWEIIIGVVALVILIGVVWYGLSVKKATAPSPQTSINVQDVLKAVPSIEPAPVGQLPQGWPKDLPLYGKIKILQSQNQTSADSDLQTEAVVVFSSSQNVTTLFKNYREWAIANNWALKGGSASVNSGTLIIALGNQSLLFTFTSGTISNQAVVNIYYTSR